MTISEMHTGFKVELDKTSSLELPAFEPEEIDYWLNLSQKKFVEERVNIYNQSTAQRVVLNKIQDDIRPLFTYETTLVSNNFEDLTADYWFLLDAYVDIAKTLEDGTAITDEKVPCDIINEIELKNYIETPTHKPYFDNPKFVLPIDVTDTFNITIDAFSTLGTDIYLFFIRKPLELSLSPVVSCELPDHTHHNIVSLAAQLALMGLNNQIDVNNEN